MERDVSIRDVTTREYVGVSESDTVLSTVRLMRDEAAGSVLVMRGGTPVGIMTERDVLEMVAENADPAETTVDQLMSRPVVSIAADRSLSEAADVMSRQTIRNLLVTDGDDIVGVLTERDVIDATGPLRARRSITTSDSPPEEADDTQSEPLANGGTGDEFGTQGVCELCGALTASLFEANGQLVCPDCRQI
ncbi:CBS domain-containing protein [Haloarchaeobius sp. TZWWS8]|uniref:CBS domain-containing protein n=1 Tax=Haloarchaeobius sp. TZWWS8 TaxID=3446121 RepID=UPI003EBAC24C